MSSSRPWSPVRSLAQGTALTVLAALSLSACGAEEEPAAASSDADSAAESAFPVVIEHAFGTTEIPEEPQRVVTVGFNDQDFVLALGVTPVGTREYFGFDYDTRPWAAGPPRRRGAADGRWRGAQRRGRWRRSSRT